MRRFFFTVLFIAGISPAIAAQAPGKPEPLAPGAPDGLTIQECLGILAGLNALDTGYRYVVAQGKPSETVETVRFKLPAKVRDAMSHNLFVLDQVQKEAQANNRRVQLEIMGSAAEIKQGSKENLIFDQRMTEYTAKPCTVQLDHILKADLDTEKNDIGASILSLLTKIIDR